MKRILLFVCTAVAVVTVTGLVILAVRPTPDAREFESRVRMRKAEEAATTFRAQKGRWPKLDELIATEDGTRPLLDGGTEAIRDGWGKPLALEVQADDTVRLSTTTPAGTVLAWPSRED